MENKKIKEWYMENYTTDDLGQEINEKATFEDLFKALENNTDIYDLIGVGDSVIRERLFKELASIKGIKYNDIYNMWLGV